MENHGEIKGSILNQPTIGNVNKNSVFGIYGDLTSLTSLNIDTSKALKVALRNEIKERIWRIRIKDNTMSQRAKEVY